jgi:hypothetical protein
MEILDLEKNEGKINRALDKCGTPLNTQQTRKKKRGRD